MEISFLDTINALENEIWQRIQVNMTNYALYHKESNIKQGIERKIFDVLKYRIDNKLPLSINSWDTDNIAHLRRIEKYKNWRISVYKRDNFTCQNCGANSKLNAHHIKSFTNYPELRYDLSNGVTLCEVCHKAWHKKNGRGN